MNILLKNGLIVDGSNTKPYTGSVLIEGEKIKQLSTEAIQVNKDVLVVDCSNLVIAPGFIDTHSHSDLDVILRPQVLPKVMQGITTELLGQDGISLAPLPIEYISPWRKNLAGLDGDSDEIDWTFETTKNYLKMIEDAKPGINEAYLVPHGNIRMEAMGLANALPTEEEMEKMRQITAREMEAGAYGLSTGLIYMPCAYGHKDELIEMCKVVAKYDGIFVVHQRSEADAILPSMEEVIEIGEKSGVKVHFSHFKVAGKNNWGKIEQVLGLLDKAKANGLTVSFDQYPYVAGSTMMGAILPPWVHDGGTNKVIERLANKELREKMKYDMENGIEGWDNFVDFAGFDNIYTTSVKTKQNEDAVGLSIVELAKLRNTNPYDAAFDLLLQEENAVGMVDFYGTEDHVKLFMKRPEMNACTDGLLNPGKPHPRLYGSFPRIIGKYVRDEHILSLEEAIYKLSHKAAKVMSLPDRGLLKKDYYADITIFDYEKISDVGDFVDPIHYPVGIEYVIVNGSIVVENQQHTNVFVGKVLDNNKR
ncbi:MAG: N-acyl-D-amino-acid deacylase family protein [Bacilli bacterium]